MIFDEALQYFQKGINMTNQQQFLSTMKYAPNHKIPLWHWGQWEMTIDRWHKEGMPDNLNMREQIRDYLAVDGYFDLINTSFIWGVYPTFEKIILNKEGCHTTYIDCDGVIKRISDKTNSIPESVDYTFKTPQDWQNYKKRLDPNTDGRLETDWLQKAKQKKEKGNPLAINVGSLYGWLRNWMGLENISIFIYDHPEIYLDYIDTIVHLSTTLIDKICPEIEVDMALYWEDMCYSNGPMLSPELFKKYMVPGYTKINEKLRQYGIDIICVDCDGVIDKLIPLWLEAGVNCILPVEVGTWKADINKFRKQYSKDLLIIGGIDKSILAKSHNEIESEVDRVRPLIEQGGYIPIPDHLIPPDVSLDNYMFYLNYMRNILE